MAFDAHKNFAVSAVATAPSPASSGTSLVVTAGHGTRFPAVPFNATVWPDGDMPTPANSEIVRVTGISTDTFTITRTQESTSARAIQVGDLIAATITAKTLTDVEAHSLQEQTTTATGAQHNFDLNGPNIFLRCTGAAPVFSGFTVQGAAPYAGCRVTIECLGTTSKHTTEDAGSTAAHRVVGPSAAGQIVGLNGQVELKYDATTGRWRAKCVDPGAPLSWTPFDNSGAALTLTGVTGAYQQWGRKVDVQWELRYPSTADASPSLIGGLPFTLNKSAGFAVGFASTTIPLYVWVPNNATNLSPLKQAGGASLTNAEMSLHWMWGSGSYFIA